MRTLIPHALLALCALCGSAQAQEDSPWYLQFGAGAVQPQDSDADVLEDDLQFETGFAISGIGGYRFVDGERLDLSLEIEGYRAEYDIDQNLGDAKTTAVLGNANLEIALSRVVLLYLVGGAGWATDVDLDSNAEGQSLDLQDDGAFAFQGKIGIRVLLGGNFSWLIGYRYFQTEDLGVDEEFSGSSFDFENVQHVFEMAFRWAV
jgi:opacity protein-like surface antigen